MLRIGVDVTAAITGGTGIARYVTTLAETLEERCDDVEVRRFALGRGVRPAPPGTRRVRVPLRVLDRLWDAIHTPPIERLMGAVDTVHASGAVLPPTRRPLVAVVQDVAPLDHPTLHPARDVDQFRRYIAGLDRADAVIAGSGTTGNRLVDIGVPSERIHVVPHGTTRFPEPLDPPLAGRRYVLAVGAPVPRKRYGDLLRAIARVADADLAVAIVGPPGPDDASLVALASDLGLGPRFHRAGPVSEAELAGWYRHAAVLAAPSVDEGFGLTLIEALASGTPVVASDIEVFREVTGGHALLVAPGDVDALAGAIEAVVANGPEIEAQLARGAAHAARYTWEACADATLAVHRGARPP